MSAPDGWTRKYPQAHLEAQAINHETFPDEAPDISRGSSALPTPPRRQTRQPDPDPFVPPFTPTPTPTTSTAAAAAAATTPPDATAALLQSVLLQQQQQQQLHNETIRAFMDEIRRMSTTTTTPTSQTPIKPPVFPAYTNDTPLDVFTAQVTTFQQHEYFDGCTWDIKAPSKDKESVYLRSELLRVLPLDLQRLFTNDTRFDNDGFLMLKRLLENLRPLSHQSKFLTMMEFANLSKGDNESEASLISRAKGIDNLLSGISIADCMPLKILSCLSDSYPGLIARYCQGNPVVVNTTVTQLEALMASEREAQRSFPNIYPPASANRAWATPSQSSPNPSSSPNTMNYPLPRGAPWEKVEDLISTGTVCPVCHSRGKWHVNEGSFRCVPLARQGKVIISDQAAADKIVADYETYTKTNNSNTNRTGSARGRGRGRGRGSRQSPSANPAAASLPPTQQPDSTLPLPTPSQEHHVRRATSLEPPNPTPKTTPESRYGILDAKMDSDSADDAQYDDADFALADNTNTDYPYCASACRAQTSPSTSSRFVSSALTTVAARQLQSCAPTIAHPVSTATQAVADSGATDNMFPDYSAFISYRRQANRFVTLGDHTKLPILGEGSAKIKLNGKVIILRRCLHVPGLRNPLYSLRQHRQMPGCGTYSDFKHGAYILFPRFTLHIDDTVDNFISYEPIGNSSPNIKIDYSQPGHYTPPAARPAAHLSIHYNIPLPKCVRAAAPSLSSPLLQRNPTSDPATISTESLNIPDKELITQTSIPLPSRLLKAIHNDPSRLPPIPPYATSSAIESRTTFDSLKLHRIFGCRRFRNQEHITSASFNAKLLPHGEYPSTIGDFATITNPPRGKQIKKRRRYLDKVHMDIVFGDCLSLGGYKYALLLVDVATRYSWIFGLQTLTGTDITAALDAFVAEAGSIHRTFHTDYDKKLIGGSALRWIHSHNSRVIAAPASRQSSNGLVESTWKTIVKMARAYLTEKQMSREFWFYAVKHATRMMNYIPGRMGRRLVSPFELVHGTKPDATTWFKLFSVGFFKMESSSDGKHLKTQSMSLAGIAVGRDDTSNTILFYNPITRSYYRPQAFSLDETRLPLAQWPGIIIPDGSLTCGLLKNNTDPTPEPFPPGTRVTLLRNHTSLRGTIANIPSPSQSWILQTAALPPDSSSPYTVLLDDGTTTECDFTELAPSDKQQLHSPSPEQPNPFRSLPSWLQQDSKVTLDCRGSFHKGYLHFCPVKGFLFVVKRTAKSAKIDWSEPLHDLPQHWTTLCADNTLLPGHNVISSFLRPNSSNNAPSANFVSAKNLLHPCPPSLSKALHPSNPDRDTWLKSYNEEKGGLENMDVFERINKKQYLLLKHSGRIGKALPSIDAEEDRFRRMLASKIKVDFMGDVDYFLGTAFTWRRHASGELSAFLSQTAFTEYMAHRFAVDKMNPVPHMTPYRSGLPVDAIPPPDPKDPDLKRRTKCYQSMVGCINWLATCTRPDVSPVLTFLASYSQNPAHQHYKAALHVIKYLLSTSEYGISYHSHATSTVQAFNHFPHHHDKEAYSDATPPPSPADCRNLTAFSDACWGGQFSSAVPDGTPLELFKFRSLSGFIISRAGGPIAWKSIRQQRTARSSCEADILATDACVAELLHIRNCAFDLGIHDASQRIVVYNNNKAAVNWADAMTSKGTKHLNLHENCVREAHHSKIVNITHIPGVINTSDLFTKELKDAAHFHRCRDSMMVSRSNFLAHQHCVLSHLSTPRNLPYYSIRSGQTPAQFADSHGAARHAFARTVSDRPTDILPERGVLVDSDRLSGSRVVLAH
eukprot:CCRYP_003142-RA/>CCRYP_003142-RA protein AED:0.35 eAED:0.14 QI:0/0/0/1/1/1/2/0/1801